MSAQSISNAARTAFLLAVGGLVACGDGAQLGERGASKDAGPVVPQDAGELPDVSQNPGLDGALSDVDAAAPPDFGPPPVPETAPSGTTGDVDTTFNHENEHLDVWDLLARLQDEGPPEYSAQLHACPKVKYATLGRILASRGVNLGSNTEGSAGRMYRESDQALGVANYAARVAEASELSAATASKLFDIFVAAAPEMIAAMPTLPACTVGGAASRVFNAQGQCEPSGLTCLMGVPAQAGHVEICNRIVARASTPEVGRTLAVAALLAAAHTCE